MYFYELVRYKTDLFKKKKIKNHLRIFDSQFGQNLLRMTRLTKF